MAKQRYDSRQVASGAGYRGPSQRRLRVGEEVRHALARVLQEGECRDPVLESASITVTEVRMSPDLRNATAFVMPLAGTNANEILAALKHCAGFLKGLIGRQLALRNTPNLVFALDDSFDQAERIHRLLSRPEVARDLQPEATAAEDRKDG
jgi:ribosome-binding factor A